MTLIQEENANDNSAEDRQYFKWCTGGEVHAIMAEEDSESGKKVVYLSDIQEVFRGEFLIKNGIMVVLPLKDKSRTYFEPKRIEYKRGVTMKIFPVDERPSSSSASNTSTSTTTTTTTVLSRSMSNRSSASSTSPVNRHLAGQLLTGISEIAHTVEEVRENQQRNQEELVDMMKTTHNWLALILDRANSIFRLTYELHEYPVPRLFVILPGRNSFRDRINPLVDKYRLYFLCECDTSSTGDGNKSRPHIHFAKHDGYDLDRPTEFFQKYGPYILTLLQLLRYSVLATGFVVPQIAGVGQGLQDGIEEIENATRKQLTQKVDEAIGFLKDMPSKDRTDAGDDMEEEGGSEVEKIEALEGADLRHLASFLKNRDETQVFGNLYRLARPNGTIKWVCLDHYRDEYKMIDRVHFTEFINANQGTYQVHEGKVEIRLSSREMAKQFYQQLEKAKFIHELVITMDWRTTLEDFRDLKAVMVSLTTILSLTVDCCDTQSRIRDLVSRGTPSTVLTKVMAGHELQSFTIRNCGEFLVQAEKLNVTNQLRRIHLGTGIEGRSQVSLISSLVKKSPRLRHLTIQLPDLPATRTLFANAKAYQFRGISVLEVQLDTGETLTGCIKNHEFSNVHLVAMDCSRELAILPFVTKMTTSVNNETDLHHLGQFCGKNSSLKEIDVQVGVAMFFDVYSLLLQKNKGIRSVYFHDKDNTLRMSDIRDPTTAKVDLLSDSVDFDRLFSIFGALPRYCGSNLVMTNEVMAILEERTQKESRLEGLWIDITLLDGRGIENAIAIIQRSDLKELFIWNNDDMMPENPPSEMTLGWTLIREIIPTLRGTRVLVRCLPAYIFRYYSEMRDLFAVDSQCQLTLGDNHNMVILDNVHDSRVANVSMQCDDLGVDLEDFYGMFGSLPSFLGHTVEILNSVAAFLSRIVAPGEGCLKRLVVDPKILTKNAQECILEVINRCMLSQLTVRYPDECLDFLVKAVSNLKQTELIIHCKVNEFIQIYQQLVGSTFVNADVRRLQLVDDACTIAFEDILNPVFKTMHSNNDLSGWVEFNWGVLEVLPSDLGYTHRITCSTAEKLNLWSEYFPLHHTDFRVDTTTLGDTGIRDMVSVISKSKLTSLRVYCSDGQPLERARRNGFLEEVMPYLAGAYLYIECRVHEFSEMRMFMQSNAPDAHMTLSWYLCDGDRYLASLSSDIPPILDLRGKRGVYYVGEHGVLEDNWDELGNTILSVGSNLVHLDTESIIFLDQDVAFLSLEIGSQSRLTSLRLSSAHLSRKGFEGMQEVINRSPGLKEFAFVCGCDFAYTMSEAALEMLVKNRKIVTELVVTGSEIRFWLRRLSCYLPTRCYLPTLTTLKIRSDGKSLDMDLADWVNSIVRHVHSLRTLETVHLKNWFMADGCWRRFFRNLAPQALEELDFSGSNISNMIIEWPARSPLKKLNLQRTFVPASAFHDLRESFLIRFMSVQIELPNMYLEPESDGPKRELFDNWQAESKAELHDEEDDVVDINNPLLSWAPKLAHGTLAPTFRGSPALTPRSPQTISDYTSISTTDAYPSFSSQSPTTPSLDQFLHDPPLFPSTFAGNSSGERRGPQMLYPTAMCLQEQMASEGTFLSGATVGEDRIRSPHDSYPPPNSPEFWTRLSQTLIEHGPKSSVAV